MTESELKQQETLFLTETLTPTVERISCALRRYGRPQNARPGDDAYHHAVLGRALLKSSGIRSNTAVGYASWRVGPRCDDVLGYVRDARLYHSGNTTHFPYHAWIRSGPFFVDLTTYLFPHMAEAIDHLDGGQTTVLWRPDFLIVHERAVCSTGVIVGSRRPGFASYYARAELEPLVQARFQLDPGDLVVLRMLLANPGMQITDPNRMN